MKFLEKLIEKYHVEGKDFLSSEMKSQLNELFLTINEKINK